MIEIKGLEFMACHGVLEEEKTVPQPFVFDVTLQADYHDAMCSDDVAQTVDYSRVCGCVKSVCCGNSFNLIEKLAREVCLAIMHEFKRVSCARVTVHKPHAPVDCKFTDISYTCTLERTKAVLSLGSNMGDRKTALDSALRMLDETDGITVLRVSDYIQTEPYGGVATGKFLNCACLAECLLPADKLLAEIHRIEGALGRKRIERWGNRTADIDIIFFGNKVVEEEGLCIPHPDYFNRDFVLIPLKQIVPDFVCPRLHKRVSDI